MPLVDVAPPVLAKVAVNLDVSALAIVKVPALCVRVTFTVLPPTVTGKVCEDVGNDTLRPLKVVVGSALADTRPKISAASPLPEIRLLVGTIICEPLTLPPGATICSRLFASKYASILPASPPVTLISGLAFVDTFS